MPKNLVLDPGVDRACYIDVVAAARAVLEGAEHYDDSWSVPQFLEDEPAGDA